MSLIAANGNIKKTLSDEAANDIRLFANDAIEQLRSWRKRGQLQILEIQIKTAIRSLDARDQRSAHHKAHRTRAEMAYMVEGSK